MWQRQAQAPCVHFGIFLVGVYCATTCLNVYMKAARGKKLI